MVSVLTVFGKIAAQKIEVHRGSSPSFGEHRGRFLEGVVPDHRLCHQMPGIESWLCPSLAMGR